MCPYFGPSAHSLILHLQKRHQHCVHFIVHCSYPGCGSSFQNRKSFSQHLRRKHPGFECEELNNEEEGAFLDQDDFEEEDILPEEVVEDNLNGGGLNQPSLTDFSEAEFILKLREKMVMTNTAIVEIQDDIKILVQEKLNVVKSFMTESEQFRPLLNDANFNQLLDNSQMFKNVCSEYKQDSFFKKHMNYLAPKGVKMGSRLKRKKVHGVYRTVLQPSYGYYLPFLQNLRILLSMPEVQTCLLQDQINDTSQMKDARDGSYFKNHELFQSHQDALAVIAYVDDIEIANPIGVNTKKHKVTLFYWTLLNIPPKYRSKLSSMQLLAVAYAKDIKMFGLESLLKDFIDGLNKLSRGLMIDVNGYRCLFRGSLLMMTADTLAAQGIGGFKEGVGNAFSFCRTCDVTTNTKLTSFIHEGFEERDPEEHSARCDFLKSATPDERTYFSRQYGVNNRSVLMDIQGFDITSCLVHDPMHLLFEGVLPYEVKLMLQTFIRTEKYFSLAYLNQRIENFPYATTELLDKPQLIEHYTLVSNDNRLRQTAEQMKTLAVCMPLMVGEKVPAGNPLWKTFLILLQIVLTTLSPVATPDLAVSLKALIAVHNEQFCRNYPEASFIPKLHYLIHLPNQMKLFGPLRSQSCMRWEAKHGFFKSRKYKSFKNLPKTMITRHQHWMCLMQSGGGGRKSNVFLYEGDTVKAGIMIDLRTHESYHSFPDLENGTLALKTTGLSINGHSYTDGTVLLLSNGEIDGSQEFIYVVDIIVYHHSKYLWCSPVATTFNAHLGTHQFRQPQRPSLLIPVLDLKYPWPLPVHYINGAFNITNCYNEEVDFF